MDPDATNEAIANFIFCGYCLHSIYKFFSLKIELFMRYLDYNGRCALDCVIVVFLGSNFLMMFCLWVHMMKINAMMMDRKSELLCLSIVKYLEISGDHWYKTAQLSIY